MTSMHHGNPPSPAPQVSIIIPSYNTGHLISETLRSAFSQKDVAVEVIVVDDGSTDGSWELLHDLQATLYPSLKILCHRNRENKGESLGRALALSEATGDYIAFLDSDDLFHEDKLRIQINAMEANPQCVLCHTAVEVVGDLSQADWFHAAFNNNPTTPYLFRQLPDYLYRCRICISSVIAKTEYLRSINFATNTVLGHGDWLCWSLLAERGKFLFLNQQLTYYRAHDSSKTSRFLKNKTRKLFAVLEFKLALFARTESSDHALRVLFSTIETLRLLLVEYLWDPAKQFSEVPLIRSNAVNRLFFAACKLARSTRNLAPGLRPKL